IIPYVKDCNTILLANHGTVTFGPTLENAYFNTEIIDAYCKILLIAKQLGRVNYFTDHKTEELLNLKKKLGYDDIRFRKQECEICGPSSFDESYSEFVPQPHAFGREVSAAPAGGNRSPDGIDLEQLVRTITEQVMAALTEAGV